MSAFQNRLCGDDWQRWANQLLVRRYGPAEYQKVPDNDRGDAGIEGFTLTEGHVYQAYGCEEPLTTAKRYEKQRNKMTADIGKFIKNKNILAKLFGSTKITRWVLFVPFFDSREIVAHAVTKTAKVLNENLPYSDSAFRVMVSDEEEFRAECDFLLNSGSLTVDVCVDAATEKQVQDWMNTNDRLLTTLEAKIAKLPTIASATEREMFRDLLLKRYLEGQDAWEFLRRYPLIYEKLFAMKLGREKFIETACMLHSGSNSELLNRSLNEFVSAIKEETKNVGMLTAQSLAWEAVADWMIRCPLRFP